MNSTKDQHMAYVATVAKGWMTNRDRLHPLEQPDTIREIHDKLKVLAATPDTEIVMAALEFALWMQETQEAITSLECCTVAGS